MLGSARVPRRGGVWRAGRADVKLRQAVAIEESQPQIGGLALIFLLVHGRLKAALDCSQIGEKAIFDGHSEIEIAEIVKNVLAGGEPRGGLPAFSQKIADLDGARSTD